MELMLANVSDSAELSVVKLRCWNTTYENIYTKNDFADYDVNYQKNKFEELIEKYTNSFYVLKDMGQIVGYFCYGEPYRPYKNYKHAINLIYLLKEYRKTGWGKKFFELAVEDFKKQGVKEFFIYCNKHNENAQKFYLKMGGTLIDEVLSDSKKNEQNVYLFKI